MLSQFWTCLCGVLCAGLLASAQTTKTDALRPRPVRPTVDVRFQTPFVIALGAFINLRSGDWDGDGKTDLAAIVGNEVRLFQGDGKGGFGPAGTLFLENIPVQVAAADLDGDSRTDIVVFHSGPGGTADEILSFLSQGDFQFSTPRRFKPPPISGLPPFLLGFVLADFNLDGKPDLLLARNSVGSNSVALGRGDGTFADPLPGGPLTYMLGGVADFNSDSAPDVLTNGIGGVFSPGIYYGRRDGTFDSRVPVDACEPLSGCTLRVIDADGDGKPDLLVQYSYWGWVGAFRILRGNGDGGFGAAQQLPALNDGNAEEAFAVLSFIDLNSDGIPDLIRTRECCVGTEGGDANYVYINPGRGFGEFAGEVAIRLPDRSGDTYMMFIDVNGDGRPDLLTTDAQHNLWVYLNAGGPLSQ